MKRLVNFGAYESELHKTTTFEEAKPILIDFIKNVQKQVDDILSNALGKEDVGTVSDEFTSNDTPTKTVTVSNGIVTNIKKV